MGKPYDHQYLNTCGMWCGEMRCNICNKPITEGDYRAYKRSRGGDWGYVTTHRTCCADDPAWAKKDAKARQVEGTYERIKSDVATLLKRHPEAYHSDIFEEVREQLGYEE